MKKQRLLVVDDNVGQLFLDSTLMPIGGASIQTFNWLDGFNENRDVVVFTKQTSSKSNSISKYKVIYYSQKNILFKTLITRILYFTILLRKNQIDEIYVSVAGINTFIWGIISSIKKACYIQRISNNITYEKHTYLKKIGVIKYILSRTGLCFADKIICQNTYQLKNISRISKSKKLMIVHNPITVKSFEINKKKDFVAWIGIFQYQKNLKELYYVAEKLPQISFKIAGTGLNRIDEETILYLSKLKELNNVEFVGMLDRKDVFEFLASSFCLLNTSRYEGFSNTFLESFSVGTPVVTKKCIDPDDIVNENQLGIVVDNYQDLPNAIVRLRENHADYHEKIISYVLNNHNPLILANKILN